MFFHRHLFFQMSADFTTPMRELVQHKTYMVVHVGRCADGMLLELWDEFLPDHSGCRLYILLPVQYARLFTTRLVLDINNGTKSVDFVLTGFSHRGFPLIQFYGSNILRYGSMAIRFSW